MIDLLSSEEAAIIDDVARERALLIFDFDGTLAPIVDDPRVARMRDHTRALLRAAAFLYPVAVVSGRSRFDVERRLGEASLLGVIGNHGAESEDEAPDRSLRVRVRSWVSSLRDILDEAGVEIEDKGYTVAVHYRRARSPAEAGRRITRLAAALPGARVFGGHAVVNVVPAEAPTKATAVASLARRCAAREVLYVGDDETDEDAFRSPIVTVAVRVGFGARSAARYFVHEQADVDRLLQRLVLARTRGVAVVERWTEADTTKPGGTA